MATRPASIVALADMIHGQEADLFVLMTSRDELKTRDGKTYYKVAFRDARREVSFPHLGRLPVGRRLSQTVEPGRVLQAARHVPRYDLWPAARHSQDS